MKAADIVRRFDTQKQLRSNLESKWDEIDRLILPLDQGSFLARADSENAKNWSSTDVWDSTAPIGAERLASMFYSGLLSGRWLGIVLRNARTNQNPKARAWVDDTVDRMFDALMSSNYPTEMASTVLHWVGYGNGCLTQDLVAQPGVTSWQGFDFASTPVREVFFEEDWRGRVLRFYRPLQWTDEQIISKWRGEDGKPHPSIPDKILKRAESNSDAGQKNEVIFCIYPRPEKAPMRITERARAPLERPFGYKYVLREGLVELGEEGGHYEMPAYVARYHRSASSQWGFGPGLLALPTVRLLNALMETVVDAAAKVVDPATLVTERGLLSELDLGQGGLTTVRSLDDIKAYESAARFDVSDVLLNDLRNMIRKYFREDDIGLKESPMMTATEASIRDDRLNRLFGPQVRRIHNDIFAPVVQTTFNHMMREKQLEDPPDEVLSDPRMQVEFYGPFMRAQRTDEVAAIERILASVYAAKKMEFRRAGYVVKDDQAVREMGERLSIPAKMFRTEAEVDDLEKRDRQIQEAAAQAEIAKTSMEARRAEAGAQEMMGGMGGMGGNGRGA